MSEKDKIKTLLVKKPLKLDCGQTISDFPLAYETYGKLNDKKDNAILVFHALTGDQFASGTNPIQRKTVGGIMPLDPVKLLILINTL